MIERSLHGSLADALADTPVVTILGPRQTGKSTLARSLDGKRTYLTLDDPIVRAEAKTDPSSFLDTHGTPITVDEVQRAPELLMPIKLRVDRNRVPGSYLLTGSANVLALPKIADSLAGRMEVIELLPFTQAEIEGRTENFIDRALSAEPWDDVTKAERIADRIVRGGFPEPALRANARRREAWFESYVKTLLERDVRDLAQIEGLVQLPRLLQLLAVRNGSSLNVSSLARDCGIPHTTLTRYLDLLKKLYLLQMVPAWSADVDTRLTKAPRAYLVDTGLACYLANQDEDALRDDRLAFGAALNGFVANELARLVSQSRRRPWLMHLRTVKLKEVDFVLEARDRRVVGIEVKATPSVQPSDFEGLRYLQLLAGDRFHRGIVLYTGSEVVRVTTHLTALPIQALWA
jgi:predicted AAA+ superfamily ATPase